MARREPGSQGPSVFTLVLSREVSSLLTNLPLLGQGSIALSVSYSHQCSRSLEMVAWVLMTILWT